MSIDLFIQELEASIVSAEPNSLKPDTRFRDLSWWDSLAVLSTLAIFDSSFGKQISVRDLAGCQTIQDIYDLGRKAS